LAPLSFAVSSLPVALWRIFKSRPDVVLCVEPTLLSAPVAIIAAKIIGVPAVLHVQDLEVDAAFAVGHLAGSSWLTKVAFAFERSILRNFDRVVTISNRMGERLRKKGVADERLVLVRNWVDTKQIYPLDRPSQYRQELGYGDDHFVVLYSGQIGPKQALHLVFEAAARVVDDARIRFVIAGEGPLKQTFEQRYGSLPNLQFLPLQPEGRLCEFLNLADCHVLPQDANVQDLVFPSKLAGMLASGKRVLALAHAGSELHEFLEGAAELVEPGDVGAMAARLREFAAGPRFLPGKSLRLAQSLSIEHSIDLFDRTLFATQVAPSVKSRLAAGSPSAQSGSQAGSTFRKRSIFAARDDRR
jgi:colanic acid biosynthesis glycosyl transferase WcaI